MQELLDKPKTSLDVQKIRNHFPILNRIVNGKQLVYLDNASTTQKPKIVTDSLLDYYQTFNANIHRGAYILSQEATSEYEETREVVAKFLNAPSVNEVIFTRNTTESLNLVAHSWGRKNLVVGDEILLTEMEHHSNLVPWQEVCRETKAQIKFIPINLDGRLVLNNLKSLVNRRTRLVSLTHVSNVLGTINPIKKIVSEIKSLNPEVLVVVDGAQASGHMKIDAQDLGVDFYAFSAHKMLGPTGVGVLWGKSELLEKMPPFLTGGDMISTVSFKEATWNTLPWKFEAGTPNIADVIAFKEAIRYLGDIGLETSGDWEKELTIYTLEKLSQIEGVKIFGPKDSIDRAGVISFNLGKIHSHDLASVLDSEGICIRSGHHCAQPLMTRLGIRSAARVSFYLYNDKVEVDKLVAGLKKAQQMIHD